MILGVGPGELTEEQAEAVLDAAEPAKRAGLETSVGAYVGQQLSKPDTGISDAIGIAAAIVILLFAFGTATAMVMPIGSAIIGLAISLSVIRLLENVVEVPSVAATLATMIGLGVGIDYALFIVTRHKLQLGEGMELRESIARATATAGGAVVFAGFTVVIALCSLAFAGIPLVSTLGFTAAIAVVVAVCAAATLLPAMLGALGPHINSLRVPFGNSGPDDSEPHGWRRWARGVASRPWRSALAALAVLVVLALPIFQLELGQNDLSALPKSTTARQNYDSMTKGFGPGVNGPLLITSKFQTAEEAERSLPVLAKAGRRGTRRRRRLRTDPRQDRDRRRLHGDLEIGALGGRDREPGRRPARHDDPERRSRAPTAPPTSAARPPATSTSPRRSPTSCR